MHAHSLISKFPLLLTTYDNPTLLHLPLITPSLFQGLPSPAFSNTGNQKSYQLERRLRDLNEPGLTGSGLRAAANANAAAVDSTELDRRLGLLAYRAGIGGGGYGKSVVRSSVG